MNVTKAAIVNKIASDTGITKMETRIVVDAFLNSILESLSAGLRIELRGFGVFDVKTRKPRMARNPKTGVEIPLDERFIPIFKFADSFQHDVHQGVVKRQHTGEDR